MAELKGNKMINKLKDIKKEILNRCAIAGVLASDVYPEGISRLGNHYPAVLIESVSLEPFVTSNNIVNPVYTCAIILITQTGYEKTEYHENMVFSIINEIYKDNHLGGKCVSLELARVEFNSDVPIIQSAYQSDALQCSRITFNIRYNDQRYNGE